MGSLLSTGSGGPAVALVEPVLKSYRALEAKGEHRAAASDLRWAYKFAWGSSSWGDEARREQWLREAERLEALAAVQSKQQQEQQHEALRAELLHLLADHQITIVYNLQHQASALQTHMDAHQQDWQRWQLQQSKGRQAELERLLDDHRVALTAHLQRQIDKLAERLEAQQQKAAPPKLACSVCFEMFTADDEHCPYVLHCGHSLCLSCICSLEGPGVPCPSCRERPLAPLAARMGQQTLAPRAFTSAISRGPLTRTD
eukprot:m51a1_g11441 putative protein (258) ;mRNA; r:3037-3988